MALPLIRELHDATGGTAALEETGFRPDVTAALSAPFTGAAGPMDQSVVTTTPTTSACAAIASIVLAAVSNMRMLGVSDAGGISGKRDMAMMSR